MPLVSSGNCLYPIRWSQMLSWEWRCSWSSADRRCSNYIWVINNLNAYYSASYIRALTVYSLARRVYKMCDYLVLMTYVEFFSPKSTPSHWSVSRLLVQTGVTPLPPAPPSPAIIHLAGVASVHTALCLRAPHDTPQHMFHQAQFSEFISYVMPRGILFQTVPGHPHGLRADYVPTRYLKGPTARSSETDRIVF